MNRITNLIKKYWSDPVWSKVIATFIVFLLSTLGIWIYSLIQKVPLYATIEKFIFFLNDEYLIRLWQLIIISFSSILLYYIWKRLKKYLKNRRKDQEIRVASTVFFLERFDFAFPDVEAGSFKMFDSKKDIKTRLSSLLKYPIYFKESSEYNVSSEPIWWFRGFSALYIEVFKFLKEKKYLMNSDELIIEKIYVYSGLSYFRNFVYIECSADQPTGLYKESYNSSHEEFAIFRGKKINRRDFDKGATIIDGKPTSTIGKAELRTRRLTNHNFIIAAKFSPYNCTDFDANSKDYFDRLLKNEIEFQEFVEWMETLPKHKLD